MKNFITIDFWNVWFNENELKSRNFYYKVLQKWPEKIVHIIDAIVFHSVYILKLIPFII